MGEKPSGDLRQAFEKSTYVRIAYDQDKIVGAGRTVDDGKYYGMIVDLVVDPDYQGQGIGSTILHQLREEMAGFRVIGLRAASGKRDFYLKHGWKKSESAFHWPGQRKAGLPKAGASEISLFE
jgi:GNAT superfamily N-acetyltransferase